MRVWGRRYLSNMITLLSNMISIIQGGISMSQETMLSSHGGIHTEYDPVTGEIIGQFAIVPFKEKFRDLRGGWFMAIQAGFEHIAQQDITGEQFRVLMHVMSKLDFENYISLMQKDIAEALGLKTPNVSRAFKKLISLGILLEGPKVGRMNTYRLDPAFGWKGKEKNYKQFKTAIETAKARGVNLEVLDGQMGIDDFKKQ